MSSFVTGKHFQGVADTHVLNPHLWVPVEFAVSNFVLAGFAGFPSVGFIVVVAKFVRKIDSLKTI